MTVAGLNLGDIPPPAWGRRRGAWKLEDDDGLSGVRQRIRHRPNRIRSPHSQIQRPYLDLAGEQPKWVVACGDNLRREVVDDVVRLEAMDSTAGGSGRCGETGGVNNNRTMWAVPMVTRGWHGGTSGCREAVKERQSWRLRGDGANGSGKLARVASSGGVGDAGTRAASKHDMEART
ncbi:hypothetical protein OsJ_23322 [Oryza sativa Japonica Group]|uniref:Uncharacterized protein n=1 Tax=Oryza sativa subsp. japonica TaxID=39947 RepID=Q6ZLC7_ORYSJ|nr:hypothetical protein OsJ_23322 [Oryza sativa Japonica Group]BAC83042.1 hypothetical protein [Oryza sativa Japonica Group]